MAGNNSRNLEKVLQIKNKQTEGTPSLNYLVLIGILLMSYTVIPLIINTIISIYFIINAYTYYLLVIIVFINSYVRVPNHRALLENETTQINALLL